MINVLLVVHLPLFTEAGTPSNLRKIVDLDAVPRAGDEIELPGSRLVPVGRVRFRADGRVSVHVEDAAAILNVSGLGAGGIADLTLDLMAHGFTTLTEWD